MTLQDVPQTEGSAAVIGCHPSSSKSSSSAAAATAGTHAPLLHVAGQCGVCPVSSALSHPPCCTDRHQQFTNALLLLPFCCQSHHDGC
jgi:hypothetical protein